MPTSSRFWAAVNMSWDGSSASAWLAQSPCAWSKEFGIDRCGSGTIWLLSLMLATGSLSSHLWIEDLSSPAIYLARICYTISLAGSFGASITFVSSTAPRHRTGEVIGALVRRDLSVSPWAQHWPIGLFSLDGAPRDQVDRMFIAAACMSFIALLLAFVATRIGVPRRVVRRSFPVLGVIRRYHPGPILVVSIALGVGIGLPFSFLRTFAAELGVDGIRRFFLVYCHRRLHHANLLPATA